jgi:hypothetical protein
MNKRTKNYTSGNKIELHKSKIIYGTNFLKQREQIFLNEGIKMNFIGNKLNIKEIKNEEIIFENKRNKSF